MNILPSEYKYDVTDKEATGIRLHSLENHRTGVKTSFAEFNPDFDVHTALAWAGARTSRSSNSFEEIFAEIYEASVSGGRTPGDKLSEVFNTYGHASVADMAPIMLYLEGLPISQVFRLFNLTSTSAGQELSTRYVSFGDNEGVSPSSMLTPIFGDVPPEIADGFDKLWSSLLDRYHYWNELLKQESADWLLPQAGLYGKTPKQAMGSVETRSLDVARNWLPMGSRTSQSLQLSARHAVDLIGQLYARGAMYDIALGQQILDLLNLNGFEGVDINADLGRLAHGKYTEGSDQYHVNLDNFRAWFLARKNGEPLAAKFTTPEKATSDHKVELVEGGEDYKMFIEYASVALPETTFGELNRIYAELTQDELRQLSSIIFAGQDNRSLMRSAADNRGVMIRAELTAALMRDYNRQRALGRTVVELETHQNMALAHSTFGTSWHMQNAEYWQHNTAAWDRDAERMWDDIHSFADSLEEEYGSWHTGQVMELLMPLGTMVTAYMTGPPAQWNYATYLRSNVGGDYGYRKISNEIIDAISASNPLFSALGSQAIRIDANDPGQLLGRS